MQDKITSRVDYDSILDAYKRIQGHVHKTPVLTSTTINQMSGAKVFFKCENLQRTGSFKVRGAHNAVLSLSETDAKHGVVTHSSGIMRLLFAWPRELGAYQHILLCHLVHQKQR